MNRIVPFSYEGKNYKIRICSIGKDFTVQAYLNNNKKANGYSYSVSLLAAIDLQRVHDRDAVTHLIEHAKNDIKNKVWEKYVDAHSASLKKTPEQSIECPKCGVREPLVSDDFEIKMFTSTPSSVIDSITKVVAENGFCEITASSLNGAFGSGNKGLTFDEQLRDWASQNKLTYEYVDKGKNKLLRFRR